MNEITIWYELWIFFGGFTAGTIFGMYVHYYHGESLANDGDKNVH